MQALGLALVLLTACSSPEATTSAAAAEPRTEHASPVHSAGARAGARTTPVDGARTTRGDGARPNAPAETAAKLLKSPQSRPIADCESYHRGLGGAVGRTLRAAGGRDFYRAAVSKLETAPQACRDGRWYVAAARLLRYDDTPIAGMTNPSHALREGLSRPNSRELLTMVAFLAPLGGGPLLPADACERVARAAAVPGPAYESEDRAAYVCAHAALMTKKWQHARERFASITMQQRYPDLALRRAQAGYCVGKRARKLEKRARRLDPTVAAAFGASHREHAMLRDQASPSELRRLSCR